MMKQKPIFTLLGLVWLLNACTTEIKPESKTAVQADCPSPTTVSLPTTTSDDSFYERFDNHIRNIVLEGSTVKFQTFNHDFVFCRGNNSWTTQVGTFSKETQPQQSYEESQKELLNPPLKTIEFQGKTYQYRVIWVPEQKAVFELTSPNSTTPQQQTLYTLKDVQEANTGTSLGVPKITAVTIHGEHLWWAVSSEQGEGFNGIATIVRYDPQADQLTVIQPEKIKGQQITDLAITGDAASPTLWMGTQLSGEGNGYLPGLGLVAYRFEPQNPNSGSTQSFNVHNTPLVGAIPDKLKLENDTLWVGTGNGVCQLKWQAPENPENWSCWRFAMMAKLPDRGVPLYSAVTNTSPAATLSPGTDGETVEVLWWMPTNYQPRKGRYEVRYAKGFTFTAEEGASFLPQDYIQTKAALTADELSFSWPGDSWHWNGERFVRGLDEVALNLVGGGVRGIGSSRLEPDSPANWSAVRGDLELLDITEKSTRVKYYSGWVDESAINPYLTVVPQERPQNLQPNPLKAFKGSGK